jgi:ankyrin repeat protein
MDLNRVKKFSDAGVEGDRQNINTGNNNGGGSLPTNSAPTESGPHLSTRVESSQFMQAAKGGNLDGHATGSSTAALTSTQASVELKFTANDCVDFMNAAKIGNLAKVIEWAGKGMPMCLHNDSTDQNPLGEATRKGHIEVVRYVLSHPTAASIGDAQKEKALAAAMADNQTAIAKLILDSCSDQNKMFENAKRALGADSDLTAIAPSLSDIWQSVLEASSKVGTSSPSTASSASVKKGITELDKNDFLDSARSGDLAKVRQYLEQGMPVDIAFGNSGITALHQAARKGHASIVDVLLSAGAGGKAVEKRQALIAAAAAGHQQIAQKLLQSFAYPDSARLDAHNAALNLGDSNAAALIARLQLQ